MKLKGITLVETVIGLAIISAISVVTVAGFSSAGNIFRQCQDLKEVIENAESEMTYLYNGENISEDFCTLKINDDISVTGELLKTSSTDNFSGYTAVRAIHQEDVEDDED